MDIFTIDEYDKLLNYYKKNNFKVINFIELHKFYKDGTNLPDKLVVIRHDIHIRDIPNAYKMIEIEERIFKKNIASYFVQWKFVGSTDYEENYELNGTNNYEEFINFCIKNHIDVQPHISLFCDSYKKLYKRDNKNIPFLYSDCKLCIDYNKKNIIKDSINEQNYECFVKSKICIKCNDSKIKNDLSKFEDSILSYLVGYIEEWKNKFKFTPSYYSCHGDGIELTKLFNPNYFSCIEKLEKTFISVNSINKYLGNTSNYKLYYKSDNSCNRKYIEKALYNDINKYQLLIHPFVWSK